MSIDENKKGRSELKTYFVKNAIPTENNFAEFIDSVLNQRDDGLVKEAGNPLSIEAAGDDTSQKKAINFYQNFADDKPSWVLSLNPRGKPEDPESNRLGFSIGDTEGNSRLFIDRDTGNVGIGTTEPGQFGLRVQGRAGFGPIPKDFNWQYHFDAGVTKECVRFDGPSDGMISLSPNLEFFVDEPNRPRARFVIKTNGNVGIGTSRPLKQLHIQEGWIAAPLLNESSRPGIALTGKYPEINLFSRVDNFIHGPTIRLGSYDEATGDKTKQWVIGTAGRNSHFLDFGFSTNNNGNPHHGIRNHSGKTVLTLLESGKVGINHTNPLAALTIRGHLIREITVATNLGPNDGTDEGQIKTRALKFEKRYDDTAIRIFYCDNLRIHGNNVAARWEIRVNGKAPPGGAIYQDKYTINIAKDQGDSNKHEPATIIGYATGIKAGNHTIGIWVGPVPGQKSANAYTGWNNSRWTIEAQEVWIV